jgi:hypothetical protein
MTSWMRRGKPTAISSRLIASESSATTDLPTKPCRFAARPFANYLTFFFRTRQSLIQIARFPKGQRGCPIIGYRRTEKPDLQRMLPPLRLPYQIRTPGGS